jgi:hypothetical protein
MQSSSTVFEWILYRIRLRIKLTNPYIESTFPHIYGNANNNNNNNINNNNNNNNNNNDIRDHPIVRDIIYYYFILAFEDFCIDILLYTGFYSIFTTFFTPMLSSSISTSNFSSSPPTFLSQLSPQIIYSLLFVLNFFIFLSLRFFQSSDSMNVFSRHSFYSLFLVLLYDTLNPTGFAVFATFCAILLLSSSFLFNFISFEVPYARSLDDDNVNFLNEDDEEEEEGSNDEYDDEGDEEDSLDNNNTNNNSQNNELVINTTPQNSNNINSNTINNNSFSESSGIIYNSSTSLTNNSELMNNNTTSSFDIFSNISEPIVNINFPSQNNSNNNSTSYYPHDFSKLKFN